MVECVPHLVCTLCRIVAAKKESKLLSKAKQFSNLAKNLSRTLMFFTMSEWSDISIMFYPSFWNRSYGNQGSSIYFLMQNLVPEVLFSWLVVSVAGATERAVECENPLACFFWTIHIYYTVMSWVFCWMAEQACKYYSFKKKLYYYLLYDSIAC